MEDNDFKPELNEEVFDIVDSAIEEELEKYGIPKRIRYELLNSINKNMEKKFENTRVQVSHILHGAKKTERLIPISPKFNSETVGTVVGGAKPIEVKTAKLGHSDLTLKSENNEDLLDKTMIFEEPLVENRDKMNIENQQVGFSNDEMPKTR